MEDKVVIVTAEDWEAIYVNGNSVYQDHRVTDMWTLKQYIPKTLVGDIEEYEVDYEWFAEYGEEYGCLPDKLDEVELD